MLKKMIIILALLSLLFSSFCISSSANSAQTWWKGTDASGVIVTDSECPVVVKNEVLTFNIDKFPETYYKTEEEMLSYSASVTAQYTFYNPSDYDVTAKLLFPFGEKPMYFYEYYDSEKDEYIDFDDTEKYEITLNGESVEKKLRYTLNSGKFEISDALSKISDEFIKDDFYYPDMPVIRYSFIVSGVDTEKYHAANAAFDTDEEESEIRYYFVNQSGYHKQKNGKARLSTWAKNGDKITVYVMGDTSAEFPDWSFYKNGGVEDKEKIEGTVTLTDKYEMTFSELAFSEYKKESGISETDWYNAVTENFKRLKNMLGTENVLNIEKDLLRWYEYEISIPSKTEVINTVNAPIYPEIDSNFSPAVYDYTYLLSPAKTWKEFGNLEIRINTPHFVVSSENFSFTETDGGYTLSLDGLPENELSFRLSTAEFPEKPDKHITDYLPIEIIIMLSVISGIIILIIAVTVIIKRKKNKN